MTRHQRLSKEQGLSDLLNYAHFVEEGVIINKDGAFVVAYKFRGPDFHSATGAQLDNVTATFNRMALFLTDGWMLHVDELRVPSIAYPQVGAFPDPVSALLDEERRELYESQDTHFENLQLISFVWKFPKPIVKTTRHWFVEGESAEEGAQSLTTLLVHFKEIVEKCLGVLNNGFFLEKLTKADMLSYLNTCITGDLLPIVVPPTECFLDVALGRKSLIGGYIPRVGDKHIRVLSLVGYLNQETCPGLLGAVSTYPLVYRWSNRFIPLSEASAEKEIKRYQKNWSNKVIGLIGIIKEVFFGAGASKPDLGALEMSTQTEREALPANNNGSTRFGYWTSTLILMHEDLTVIKEAERDISQYLHQVGFNCVIEDVNALDAWLGSIPGHGGCNVRRFFLSAFNVAHMLPLYSIWSGDVTSSRTSLLAQNAPPVFYAATQGKTPFRFHLDVGDVGHQIVLGPTGAGKSVYLGFLISQFLRYPNAQIFVFDKDHSHHGLVLGLGGIHYNIGQAENLVFCPLADLSTPTQCLRACHWIEMLVELQHVALTPDIRGAIHHAILNLSDNCHIGTRNLTIFCAQVQHEAVRAALQYYTLAGPVTLLDSSHSDLQKGYLHVFEMHWLLGQKPDVYLPVLMHLFDEIESRLDKANATQPTLIVLEEAWAYVQHPFFAKKIQDWLKTLRKKNARVIFATQSPADLYDPSTQRLTQSTAVLLESCPTKVFLPNPVMDANIKDLYQQLGLSDRQIDIIYQESTPKQDYYLVTPQGNRLIDLGFHSPHHLALSFIALSNEKRMKLQACQQHYGKSWLVPWLQQEGHARWAKKVSQHKQQEALCKWG